MIALMAVDPGGTTGVGWGYFPGAEEDLTLAERCAEGKNVDSFEITGGWKQQAAKLALEYIDFEAEARLDGCELVELVVEDFILRKLKSSDRQGIYPVYIRACLEGILIRRDMRWVFQQPSVAKAVTNERLRDIGLYVVGSEHRRDAMRHLAARLRRL